MFPSCVYENINLLSFLPVIYMMINELYFERASGQKELKNGFTRMFYDNDIIICSPSLKRFFTDVNIPIQKVNHL